MITKARILGRSILIGLAVSFVAACSDNEPTALDASSAEAYRDSLAAITADMDEHASATLIEAVAAIILVGHDQTTVLMNGADREAALRLARGEIEQLRGMSITGVDLDGLEPEEVVERARVYADDKLEPRLERLLAEKQELQESLDAEADRRAEAQDAMGDLALDRLRIDRGVLHEADRARVTAEVENGFQETVRRITFNIALRPASGGDVLGEAEVSHTFSPALPPGRRERIEAVSRLSDSLTGDIAAAHRNGHVTAEVRRIEFTGGNSLSQEEGTTSMDRERMARLEAEYEELSSLLNRIAALSLDPDDPTDTEEPAAAPADMDEDDDGRLRRPDLRVM